jgi:hypothetical protein
MTNELCQSSCKSAGYSLAATECYCDNSLRNGGGPASDGNAGCSMVSQLFSPSRFSRCSSSDLVSRLVMATHQKSGTTSPLPIIDSPLLTTSLAAAQID